MRGVVTNDAGENDISNAEYKILQKFLVQQDDLVKDFDYEPPLTQDVYGRTFTEQETFDAIEAYRADNAIPNDQTNLSPEEINAALLRARPLAPDGRGD